MHRRSVDFPEPLGPTTHTVSPGMTARSMPASNSCPPYCLQSPRSATAGTGSVAMAASHDGSESLPTPHEIFDTAAERPVEEGGGQERLEGHEVERLDRIRGVGQLGNGDDREKGGILD